MRKRSVVLLSGGLDSSANLALCRSQDEPVCALTIDYGQRAASGEARAARRFCDYYDVRHELVELGWLGALGGSALTDPKRSIPKLAGDQLDDRVITERSAEAVWVPNRNGIFIQVAAAYAERIGAEQVVVGFNAEEAATFPDNSVEFLRRSSQALELSTRSSVRVGCYTAEMTKSQIVPLLQSLSPKFPFELVWSCYESGALPCGRCESCQRLSRAMNSVSFGHSGEAS